MDWIWVFTAVSLCAEWKEEVGCKQENGAAACLAPFLTFSHLLNGKTSPYFAQSCTDPRAGSHQIHQSNSINWPKKAAASLTAKAVLTFCPSPHTYCFHLSLSLQLPAVLLPTEDRQDKFNLSFKTNSPQYFLPKPHKIWNTRGTVKQEAGTQTLRVWKSCKKKLKQLPVAIEK